MAYKIYRTGRYVIVEDTVTDKLLEQHADKVLVTKITADGTRFGIVGMHGDVANVLKRGVNIADILDEDGIVYTAEAFWTWAVENTGSAESQIAYATETTLQSVLSALQNGTDYESKLVVDNNSVAWLEIRIWNTGTQTFDAPRYYSAGSNIEGTPATPIVYINPTNLLSTIAGNTTGLSQEATLLSCLQRIMSIEGLNNQIQTNTTGLSQEATQLLMRTADLVRNEILTVIQQTLTNQALTISSLEGKNFATETTLSALNGKDFATQTTLELVRLLLVALEGKDFATNTAQQTEINTLAALRQDVVELHATVTGLDAEFDIFHFNFQNHSTQVLSDLDILQSTTVKLNNVIATGIGSVENSLRGSVINTGDTAGTFNGILLPAGVSLPWGNVGTRDVYSAISYDATGTTFIIEYTTIEVIA